MPHDHHHHGHHHGGVDPGAGDRRVYLAVVVNIGLTVVQIVAGVLSGSLALIADAIHNLSDALSLVIAAFARRIARRPADADMTFGYGRAEVVAALVNYTTLVVIALYLIFEGVDRLFNPTEVHGWTVVIVAGVALVIDLATALLIFRLSKNSMNMRAAFLHNVMDALGSVAVIVSGTLIILFDWRLVDPLVTLGISAYILVHVARDIAPVVRVLMLGSPADTSTEEVLGAMEAVEGVANVHHVHLWMMGEAETSLEAHAVLADGHAPDKVKAELKTLLVERFGIAHSVLEIETAGEDCHDHHRIGHETGTPEGSTHRHA